MSSNQPVVLIVDDVPANIDVLHGVLRDQYKVRVATNGARALELAHAEPRPDLILLDIMMPGMDGYEVCARLKEDEATAPIPIVFVTAMADDDDEQKGLALGAVDYVTKPFNPDSVLSRVRNHLAVSAENRALARENREMRAQLVRAFTDQSEENVRAALSAGPGDTREFLESLGTSPDRTVDPTLTSLRCVAGFLNSSGGTLYVGVSGRGVIEGFEAKPFASEDELVQHWVNLIVEHLGAAVAPLVRTLVREVGAERLLVVECLPAPRPVFHVDGEEERFYVRSGSETRRLRASESVPYIEGHFAQRATQQPAVAIETPRPATLWEELAKRRVLRTAVIYVATAWAFTEAGTAIAAALEAPAWVSRVLVLLFVVGFPIAVGLSWLYDIQIQRTAPPERSLRRKVLAAIGWGFLLALLGLASYNLISPASGG